MGFGVSGVKPRKENNMGRYMIMVHELISAKTVKSVSLASLANTLNPRLAQAAEEVGSCA